jgi:hypothetical protein
MLPSAWSTSVRSSESRRGRPPALGSLGVCLARASIHRRTPRSALGDRVQTLGSSSPNILLSISSSLLSRFSVLSLRLHTQLPSRVSRELQLAHLRGLWHLLILPPLLASSAESLVIMPMLAQRGTLHTPQCRTTSRQGAGIRPRRPTRDNRATPEAMSHPEISNFRMWIERIIK